MGNMKKKLIENKTCNEKLLVNTMDYNVILKI